MEPSRCGGEGRGGSRLIPAQRPRLAKRVEGKAGRGTEADVRQSNVDSWSHGGFGSAASVALNLCVNVSPELWSRREPRAGRGAPGETEE